MNALIINCSPVKTGATARIAEIIKEHLTPNHQVHSICIDDYAFRFCRGCRACHRTGQCVQHDGVDKIMEQFEWAQSVICVSPSYWADVPGQFKSFIDRCTPWCNTHEPHACLSPGKKGYAVALRTGPNMRECERILDTIEHFYGHLEIEKCGRLGLCSVEYRNDAAKKENEILAFCERIR